VDFRCPCGRERSFFAILQALVLLDELAPDLREDGKRLHPSGRRRSLLSRWVKRVSPSKGSNDNDDDPPPAPAGFGMPFRPKPLSPARGACLERARE
jgi:hypothetical protein